MNRHAMLGLTLAGAASAALAQDEMEDHPVAVEGGLQDTIDATGVAEPEITITATRTAHDTFDVSRAVSVFDRDEVQQVGGFVAMRTVSRRHPAIWFDEPTGTTTDPVIRGFAGFNLLALVDGNTLSTLWGEGGFGRDDMYGKLDPEIVERIEVLRGPGSVLYGSNALGGVINVITRRAPIDFTEEGWDWGGRVKLSLQTNFAKDGDAAGARTEFYGADPNFRFLLGGSARDFDHVRGGGDLGTLEPSDGREQNWDFSGEYRLDEGRVVRLTVQDVHRDHMKRYYRPLQDNENDREAVALSYRDDRGNDIWDSFEAKLYHQYKRDGRRFFDTMRRGEAITRTNSGGLQATRDVGAGHVLTGGLQFELTEADSPDDEQFTYYFPEPKRRDAPRSDWTDYGIYVQDEWRVAEKWSLTGSARYDHMIFQTKVDDAYQPALGDPEADEFRDSVGALTGGLGALYRATENVHLVANWGRGFRQNAPNFGFRQLGDGVLIPNQLLDPTTSDNVELGVKGRWTGARFEAFVYKSFIENWQGDFRSATVNGQSWRDFNGNGSRDANESFVQQVEGGEAEVYGLEITTSIQPHHVIWDGIAPHWSVWGGVARNVGRVDATENNPNTEPLRHTQPTRGLLGIRWDNVDCPQMGLYVEGVAEMVNRYHDIPSDRLAGDLAWRRDPQDGTSAMLRSYGGTPGYTVFSLYTGVNLTENMTLRVGVENLTNKKYRAAHSRMDAPGVTVMASLEVSF